jgi:hypothetical protein
LRCTKGDKPAGSAGTAQAAQAQRRQRRHSAGSAGRAQAAPEKNRQRWLRIHKGRRKQAEKDVVDSMKRGRRGSGAGVSAGVPEAGLGRSTEA